MEYEELLELAKGRRTFRAIKPDPIPDEVVEKLLEAARWAPTGFNMQPLEMLVVKDLELTRWASRGSSTTTRTATSSRWRPPGRTGRARPGPSRPTADGIARLAPVDILVDGGHPPPGRACRWPRGTPSRRATPSSSRRSRTRSCTCGLAAHSLGLAAQPVSAVKYPKVAGAGQASPQPAGLHLRLRHLPRRLQRHGRRPARPS